MDKSCVFEYDYSELRGRIKTRIGTEGEFARLIGRTHQYVSSIFNGKAYFDMKDISKASEVLEIPIEQIGFFFYTYKVHECEQKGV